MRFSEPVNRLMTEAVLSIDVSAPAGEILRYFAQYPVHHLPVVDKNVVVGMLSSADVMKLEAFLPKAGNPIDFLNQRFSIERIMRRPPITIGAHAAVEDAAALMAKHGVHALPVVTDQDHLLGIITTTDVIQAALKTDAPAESKDRTDAGARMKLLEDVLTIAERYVRAGQDERLHTALVRAIEKVRAAEGGPALTLGL